MNYVTLDVLLSPEDGVNEDAAPKNQDSGSSTFDNINQLNLEVKRVLQQQSFSKHSIEADKNERADTTLHSTVVEANFQKRHTNNALRYPQRDRKVPHRFKISVRDRVRDYEETFAKGALYGDENASWKYALSTEVQAQEHVNCLERVLRSTQHMQVDVIKKPLRLALLNLDLSCA